MMRRISLTTDFSAEGEEAFYTALALAVAYRARLEILHVSRPGHRAEWDNFPRVRDVLTRWGLLPPGAAQEEVYDRLGVEIGKIEIYSHDAAAGISEFVVKHGPDLLVAASHGRTGLNWWLAGSVALETLRRTALPTLLIGPSAKPFVNAETGAITLSRVLFPVAVSPSPGVAAASLSDLMGEETVSPHYVHVAETAQSFDTVQAAMPGVERLEGDVVPAILAAAARIDADMIVMPTAGHQGFMDALRGSTTQRVLHEASCPVLALPA